MLNEATYYIFETVQMKNILQKIGKIEDLIWYQEISSYYEEQNDDYIQSFH